MNAREIRHRADEAAGRMRTIGKRLADNPVAALLAAVAVGFLVGLVLRLGEPPGREK